MPMPSLRAISRQGAPDGIGNALAGASYDRGGHTMTDCDPKDWRIERASGVAAVDPAEWDACAPDATFTSHAWLAALEACGPALPSEGWTPRHLLARDAEGRLAAIAPLYLKAHSDLEIGSDFGWSLAHERAVGPYYPKLQVEVPGTPWPGSRLMVGDGPKVAERRAALVDALIEASDADGVSSLHLTFLTSEEWKTLAARGFLCDYGIRFVWHNRGYSTFEDFLGDAKSRNRRMIRWERRRLREHELRFEFIEGEAITPQFIDNFIPLYRATFEKYGGRPPLEATGFHQLRDTLRDRLMFTVAVTGEDIVAAVMYVKEPDALVAMHWGASVQVPFLHFELSYYMGIEYAIAHGLARFDVGPVGKHKTNRGFAPEPSFAAHWFRDEGFAQKLRPGLERRMETVRAHIDEQMQTHALNTR